MPDATGIPDVPYGDFSLSVHRRAAHLDRVVKAQVELTYRCNLHCTHCYTDPYNKRDFFPRELSFAELTRILDEMADLGILWLNLTGGEIFVRPDFFAVYEYAYRKGFLLMLYTNGTIFTEAIVARLTAMPPFSIDVSCHSVTEEAFDRFTQVPGSFRAFRRSLEILRQSGLPFTFKTKAMTWNKEELPAIRRFVESFGREFGATTSLSPRLNGDLAPLAYRLSPEEVLALEDELGRADAEACGDSPGWPPPPDRLSRCGCGTNTIHLNAWGELGTCTLQYERRVSLRDSSLRDAIDKLFSDVRTRAYRSDSPCRTCDLHAFCDKKPTEARLECDDPEAPIPYECDVALLRAQRAARQPLLHPLKRPQAAGQGAP